MCLRLRANAAAAAAAPRRARLVVRAASEAPSAPKAKVSFTLPHHVEFGQEICVVGEADTLGKWDATAAVPLNWNDGDIWTVEAELPIGASVEYKYIIRSPDNGEVLEWQPCENLVIQIDPAATTDGPVVVKDEWEGAAHELLIGPQAAEVAAAIKVAAEATAAAAAVEAPAAEVAPVAEEVPEVVAAAAAPAAEVLAATLEAAAPEPVAAAAVEAPAAVAPKPVAADKVVAATAVVVDAAPAAEAAPVRKADKTFGKTPAPRTANKGLQKGRRSA